MRYALCVYSCGYCGCNEERAVAFPDEMADIDIEWYFKEGMTDYMYDTESVIGSRDDFDDDEDYEQTLEDFYGDCSYDWHFVEPDTDEFENYEWEQA